MIYQINNQGNNIHYSCIYSEIIIDGKNLKIMILIKKCLIKILLSILKKSLAQLKVQKVFLVENSDINFFSCWAYVVCTQRKLIGKFAIALLGIAH